MVLPMLMAVAIICARVCARDVCACVGCVCKCVCQCDVGTVVLGCVIVSVGGGGRSKLMCVCG